MWKAGEWTTAKRWRPHALLPNAVCVIGCWTRALPLDPKPPWRRLGVGLQGTCWCASCCAWTSSGYCPHTLPKLCRPFLTSHPSWHRCEPRQMLDQGGCHSDLWLAPSSGRPWRNQFSPAPPGHRSYCRSLSGCHWRGWCPSVPSQGQKQTKPLKTTEGKWVIRMASRIVACFWAVWHVVSCFHAAMQEGGVWGQCHHKGTDGAHPGSWYSAPGVDRGHMTHSAGFTWLRVHSQPVDPGVKWHQVPSPGDWQNSVPET